MTPSSRSRSRKRAKNVPAQEHGQAPKTPTVRAARETAEVTYVDQMKELPGELRYRVASQSRHPAELARIASVLQDTIDYIRGEGSSDELRTASTRLAAEIEHAHRILMRLTAFSGELDGIAWTVQIREELEGGNE